MVFNPIFVPRTGADVNQDSGKQSKVASANYMFSDIIKVYMNDGSETASGTVQGILAKKYSLAEGEALESAAGLSDTKDITTDDGLIISGDVLQSTKIQAVQLVEFAAAFLPVANPKISSETALDSEPATSVIKSGSTQAIQIKNYLPAEFSSANIAGSMMQPPVLNDQGGNTAKLNVTPENNKINSAPSQLSGEKIIESLHDAFAELANQSESNTKLEQPEITLQILPGVSNKELTAKTASAQSFATVQAANVKPTVAESILQTAHTASVNQPVNRQSNQSILTNSSDAALIKETGTELGLEITEVKIAPKASSQSNGSQKTINAESSVSRQATQSNIKNTVVTSEVNTIENKMAASAEGGSAVVKPGFSSAGISKVEQEVSVRTASGNTASVIPSEKPSQNTPADGNTVKPGVTAEATAGEVLRDEDITAPANSKSPVPAESKPAAEHEEKTAAAKIVEPARSSNTVRSTAQFRTGTDSNTVNTKPETAENTKTMVNTAPQMVSASVNKNSATEVASTKAEPKYNTEIKTSANTQSEIQKPLVNGNEIKETAQQQKNIASASVAQSKTVTEEISAKTKTPSLTVPHVIKSDMPVRGIKRSVEAAKDSAVKPSGENLRTEGTPLKAAAPNADENVANVVQKGKIQQQPQTASGTTQTENLSGKEKPVVTATKAEPVVILPKEGKANTVHTGSEASSPEEVSQAGKPFNAGKSQDLNAEVPNKAQFSEKAQGETENFKNVKTHEKIFLSKSSAEIVNNSEQVENASFDSKNISGQKIVTGTNVKQNENKDVTVSNENDTKKFGLKFDTESIVKEKVSSSLNSRAQATDQDKAAVSVAAEKAEAADNETVLTKNTPPEKLENLNIAVDAKPVKAINVQAQEDNKIESPGNGKEKSAPVKPHQSNTGNGNMQRDDSSESQKKSISTDKQPVTAYSSKAENTDVAMPEETDASVYNSEAYRSDNAAVHREVKQAIDTDKKIETGTASEKETPAVSKVNDKTSELNTKEAGNPVNTKNTFAADAPPTHMRTIRASEAMKEVQTLIESRQKDTMVFQLDPENMGKMKVTLTNMENVLRAHIEVETESARKSLEGNMQQLLQKLESAGVQVHSVHVTLQQQDQSKRQPQYTNKRMNYNAEDEPALEEEIGARELGYNTVEYLV